MKISKFVKYSLTGIAVLLLLPVIFVSVLYLSADMKEPKEINYRVNTYIPVLSDSLRVYGPNHLRFTESGLLEQYITGTPYERGIAVGQMGQDLLYFQEKVFVDQIREFIPSDSYLKFLRFCLILFNRNLGSYIADEFREEISGVSQFCTDEYNAIGTPYERQLNYHAAHDIGHTMQDYMLVGCSAFGVWGDESTDATLLIGRNFDFYVGDDFARNKMVTFCKPENGYAFASVGWAGMMGVLSGMNSEGLTVSMNAAKSAIPFSAATPISILAREILQYASTIEEAYEIAVSRKTFVSESLLIGSSKDAKAVVIEKSPRKTALYQSKGNRILCTNHFQSEAFVRDKRNVENIAVSDSPYRMERLEELLNSCGKIDEFRAVEILRDYRGIGNKNIGLSNEMALNQFIAHHSVVFKPEQRLMWVSTSPWQLGQYVAYDLNQIFGDSINTEGFQVGELAISKDVFLDSPDFSDLMNYRSLSGELRKLLSAGERINLEKIDDLTGLNPEYFGSWELAGDCYMACDMKNLALECWRKSLDKEIPTFNERERIEKKIKKHEKV